MIILIEKNKYTDITLASVAHCCSPAVHTIVTDNVDTYFDENTDLEEPVFFLRGDSVKIVTDKFEQQVRAELQDLIYFGITKQFPGAYFQKSFHRAYELDGIADYVTRFDTDVMLVNPRHYREHRNSNIAELKRDKKVSLMPYNLNSKDDYLMTQIMEPYKMLKQNVWYHQHAALLNFSEQIITADNIESAVLMPFDMLHQYTHNTGIDLEQHIADKARASDNLFGNIREALIHL